MLSTANLSATHCYSNGDELIFWVGSQNSKLLFFASQRFINCKHQLQKSWIKENFKWVVLLMAGNSNHNRTSSLATQNPIILLLDGSKSNFIFFPKGNGRGFCQRGSFCSISTEKLSWPARDCCGQIRPFIKGFVGQWLDNSWANGSAHFYDDQARRMSGRGFEP